MELPHSNTQAPVYCYTRTELLSLRTKTSLLSLSTVDRLKDLNIGYHLPRRHRSCRGITMKKQNLHLFIVASFNAQSVKGNDIICKRCEISTFIKDNGVDLFFLTETWLSAQSDEGKTVELAPSGFDVRSFPRQSRSRGGEIAIVCKSTLGSNITFKTNLFYSHMLSVRLINRQDVVIRGFDRRSPYQFHCQCGKLRYRRHTEAESWNSIAGIGRTVTRNAIWRAEKVRKLRLPTVSVGDSAAKRQLPFSHIVRSSAGIQHTTLFLSVPPSTKPMNLSYWLSFLNSCMTFSIM